MLKVINYSIICSGTLQQRNANNNKWINGSILNTISKFILLQQGPGVWSLTSLDKCSIELKEEIITLDLYKHKLNRTHDGISADGDFLDDIGDNYGAS